MESKKKWYKWTYRTESYRLGERIYVPWGREGIIREFGKVTVHTAICKMDNQQGPIIQHMELYSMLCASLHGRCGGRLRREPIHVHAWLSSFAVHLKPSQHCWLVVLQYKIKSLKEKFHLMCGEIKTSAVPRASSF